MKIHVYKITAVQWRLTLLFCSLNLKILIYLEVSHIDIYPLSKVTVLLKILSATQEM